VSRYRGWLVALVVLLNIATVWVLLHLAEQRLRGDAQTTLQRQQQTINNSVDRARHLPVAIANHPHVIATLLEEDWDGDDKPNGSSLIVSEYLQALGEAANASLLYVLDTRGFTRSSSNWASDVSLVGNRYLFRPYFQDALLGREARYYAVGVTTSEAGYYFAQPVYKDETIIGVAVAKIELESLQTQWESGQETSLLIDEYGIVIIAGDPQWRYRATRDLNQDDLAAFRSQRKFANYPLDRLSTQGSLAEDSVVLDNRRYLIDSAPLPEQGWTIVQFQPASILYRVGVMAIALSFLLWVTGTVAYLYLRERQRKNKLSAAALDAATMRQLNEQLEAEISEREKAQYNLKEAQAELIQASKLAALGQMSAAIVHEVNQPLSAIRTFSASAKLLLERNRINEVHANLDEIKALTQRLATLTSDLKIFARKSDASREPVNLQLCAKAVSALIKPDLDERGIRLQYDMPDETVMVLGSAIRIEQVLSNLLRNAMDATENTDYAGSVRLTLSIEKGDAIIRVQDNGHGLDDTALNRVFEPFFTTKPLGEGVGLGLAISYGIVEELGGQLRVRNADDGGALFSVRLPYIGSEHGRSSGLRAPGIQP